MMTSFYVINFFVNHSLTSSRTVPLTLRPPTPTHDAWVGGMALAPSLWPPASHPPPAIYGVVVAPLGAFTFASLRAVVQQPPQPNDFDALCTQLRAGVQQELPAWRIDEASPITPTHARYNGELWEGPWEIECWAGVTKA